MKKVLLTLVFMAMATIGAHSQKLGFTTKDGAVADGSTVVCTAAYNLFGLFCCETGSLALKNYTTDDITCSVTVQLVDNTIGSMPEICMGGNCASITAWPFQRTFTCSASKPVHALYEVAATNYGELNSIMTVTGGGEKHTIYIKFSNPDPTGIDNAAMSDGKCTVYDLHGNVVAGNVAANGISTLKQGLYIVRSSGTRQVRKMLVR